MRPLSVSMKKTGIRSFAWQGHGNTIQRNILWDQWCQHSGILMGRFKDHSSTNIQKDWFSNFLFIEAGQATHAALKTRHFFQSDLLWLRSELILFCIWMNGLDISTGDTGRVVLKNANSFRPIHAVNSSFIWFEICQKSWKFDVVATPFCLNSLLQHPKFLEMQNFLTF